jgi:hypothetical protein
MRSGSNFVVVVVVVVMVMMMMMMMMMMIWVPHRLTAPQINVNILVHLKRFYNC